jgi:hypothetical protein
MNLVVTIDTEEDNWADFGTSGHTVHNIRRIPDLQRLFDDFGVIPTYLVSYPVAVDETASSILRSIVAARRCEIGAHCHPWNTPPFVASQDRVKDSMLCNLPADVQHAKIRHLHETIQRTLGVQPALFRSGRWGLGADVTRALVDLAYTVETSVTPYVDWTADHGPDFSTIPPRPFLLDGENTLGAPGTHPLLEVPLTIGFLQSNFALRSAALRAVQRGPVKRLPLTGILDRVGLASKVWLSPEVSTTTQMIRLTRQMQRQNYPLLNFTFHSPSLQAQLTPFVRSRSDEQQLVQRVRDYLTFARAARITPIKLSDVPDLLGSRGLVARPRRWSMSHDHRLSLTTVEHAPVVP